MKFSEAQLCRLEKIKHIEVNKVKALKAKQQRNLG